MTKDEFIEKAKAIHGDKYDYSSIPDVITFKTKITLTCNEKYPWGEPHGEFTINAIRHINRQQGCPRCNKRHRRTKEEFVKEATYVHKGLYTYDDFEWVDTGTKGKIHCTKHNIDFEMTPSHHLDGEGCPKCRYEKSSASKTIPFEKFEEKANKIHNGKYTYLRETYVNGRTDMTIICPEHGEFRQTPANHTSSFHPQGCPECGKLKCAQARTVSYNEFVEHARAIHGDKYEYKRETYKNESSNVDIYCKIHGWFPQKGTNHIYLAQGCPKCSNQTSRAEEEIANFLRDELDIKDVVSRTKDIIAPYELDLSIPSMDLSIEFNGLVWHSTKFNKAKTHLLNKTELCEAKGIRLIHIFEDEWDHNQEVVKNTIRVACSKFEREIPSEDCEIEEVSKEESKKFLTENHIMGYCESKYDYGLYHDSELVSLMTFGKARKTKEKYNNAFELLRFCDKGKLKVIGAAKRLLGYFIEAVHPETVLAFADRRWYDKNFYLNLSFEHIYDTPVDYSYVDGKYRRSKTLYSKTKLVEQGANPYKTEEEILKEMDIYRIYDCGCSVFKLSLK